MRPFSEMLSLIAATAILFMENYLKVFWITASSVAAKMIYFFISRDTADKYFVNDSVNRLGFSFPGNIAIATVSIFAPSNSSEPEPAGCMGIDRDSFPDAFREFRDMHSSSINRGMLLSQHSCSIG
jgi:hypothetical protein